MLINTANLNKIRVGFVSLYTEALRTYTPLWSKVAMMVPSTTGEEKYGWLGATTRFREWLGDRVIQNVKEHDFSIKNKKWEDTVGVPRTSIADDNLGVYSPMFRQLGYDAGAHPDQLIFDLLKAGFTGICYDGQYFFDTDHPVLDANGVAQSVSNSGGGSGTGWYLLDTSKPIKPLIYQVREDYQFVALDNPEDPNVFMKDELIYGAHGRSNVGYGLWQLAYGSKQTLNAANYQAAREAMMSLKGDNGRPLGIVPNILVVPPSLEGEAKEILQAERNAAGATNIYRNTADLLVVSMLA